MTDADRNRAFAEVALEGIGITSDGQILDVNDQIAAMLDGDHVERRTGQE